MCSPFRQGKADDLAALVPNLGELDLTDNLLSSWQPVAAMLQALPQLHTVVLTQNKLALNPEGACGYPVLTNLRSLVLNSCGVSWQQVSGIEMPMRPHCLGTEKTIHWHSDSPSA